MSSERGGKNRSTPPCHVSVRTAVFDLSPRWRGTVTKVSPRTGPLNTRERKMIEFWGIQLWGWFFVSGTRCRQGQRSKFNSLNFPENSTFTTF